MVPKARLGSTLPPPIMQGPGRGAGAGGFGMAVRGGAPACWVGKRVRGCRVGRPPLEGEGVRPALPSQDHFFGRDDGIFHILTHSGA